MVRRAGQWVVWRQKVVREWRMFWWESRARSSRRMRGWDVADDDEDDDKGVGIADKGGCGRRPQYALAAARLA